MALYKEMAKSELLDVKETLQKQYDEFKARGLKLDMSRGKPGADQLDLSNGILTCLTADDLAVSSGIDIRNYGCLEGLAEARKLMGDMLGVPADNVIIGGNASLNLMYDTMSKALVHGVAEGCTPWLSQGKIKFLCPAPGYDRHFAICETFGIEMIPITINADGPDMDTIEKLVSEDESIKGIWCVPKYSNPGGVTYSDEVVKRFANLSPKADDFRIFWDNAYCVHDIYDDGDKLLNIFDEMQKTSKQDMLYMFSSTSKVTYPGAGISCFVSSDKNIAYMKKLLGVQTIGYDKINQLRHVRFFKDVDGLLAHMKKLGETIRPKFEAVLSMLESEVAPSGVACWNKPKGGYFISLDVMNGCAKRVVSLCKEAGVVLTGAGATYPYKNDPDDKNIRIAPTYPTREELSLATELLCICIKLASAEKLLSERV